MNNPNLGDYLLWDGKPAKIIGETGRRPVIKGLNQLGKISNITHRPKFASHKEQPFSTNEMHYGRNAPSKYTWEEIQGEAIAVGYKVGSSKNKLPIIKSQWYET